MVALASRDEDRTFRGVALLVICCVSRLRLASQGLTVRGDHSRLCGTRMLHRARLWVSDVGVLYYLPPVSPSPSWERMTKDLARCRRRRPTFRYCCPAETFILYQRKQSSFQDSENLIQRTLRSDLD